MDENIILDNRVAAPPQPRRSPGSNAKQKKLSRLRAIALDELESPLERIEAARKILQIGASERSVPIIRKVLKLYIRSANGEVSYRALKVKARLARLLELKQTKLPQDIENTKIEIAADCTDLTAIALEPEMAQPPDPWDAPPPLDSTEQFRIIEIQRSSFNGRALLDAALDGRAFTIENLNKLFLHMTKSCAAGGCVLAEGRLYEEIKAILVSHGIVPASDKQASGFGADLLAELNAR